MRQVIDSALDPGFRRDDGVEKPFQPRSFRRKPESSTVEDMERTPCVYILASKQNGTLYTGVTSNIARRVWEHRSDAVPGFTRSYAIHRLVYFEFHETIQAAITRERQIKEWKRTWKLDLIEGMNPEWRDLYDDLNR